MSAREALELLAEAAAQLQERGELQASWLKIDEESGALYFNNEYQIDDSDAVNMAMVLLAFARRRRRV